MSPLTLPKPDPKLDLVLDRVVDVPHELVWTAWTTPEHLAKWYVPKPWTVTDCEIDLRPGGIFRTVMRSPEGEDFENMCCFLDIVENERLVWTDALHPGYRPAFKPLPQGRRHSSPRSSRCCLRAAAPAMSPPSCIATRPIEIVIEDWVSMTAGARCSTSSSRTSGRCERMASCGRAIGVNPRSWSCRIAARCGRSRAVETAAHFRLQLLARRP